MNSGEIYRNKRLAKRVITFGTFDLFHLGHLRLLERAKHQGDILIVGVSTDDLNFKKKKRLPVCSQIERVEIIKALRCVDEVFLEESLEQKREYILRYNADILVMGDDWEGRFDEFKDCCDVIYVKRTPSVSTTQLIEKIQIET